MTSLPYRTSGMDFSDGRRGTTTFEKEMASNGPAHLSRNKTERRRLQGLMQTGTRSLATIKPTNVKLLKWKERWAHWMVNNGGRQIFVAVWLFLHALVFAFGFMNYYLKDNLTTARATFGLGYRESFCLRVTGCVSD